LDIPMNVSLRQIRAFLMLAEQRSFTRAATLTRLSQPAFSELVRSLEVAVKLQLFDRSTRRIELTAEGQQFLEPARRIIAEVDHALAGMRDVSALRRGRAAIALLPSLAADWLPAILARYRAAHPDIELDVADVLSERCIERVAEGRADFAIAAIRANTPDLIAEHFCNDNFHLICRADHPLATAALLRARDMQLWPFVQLARNSSVRQYLDMAFHPRVMNSVMEVEQLATVMGMVRAGLGISIVPSLTLFHFNTPDLVSRPMPMRGLKRQLYLVRRRDKVLSQASKALYDMVVASKPVQSMPREATRRRARA
jgi:DNA-binding transcriptional LysR family regulator